MIVKVVIVALFALASLGCGSSNKLLPISDFKNFGEGVLVICANEAEKKTVVDFLVQHNRMRHPSMKFTLQNRGGYHEALVPVRKIEDKGMAVGQYPSGTSTVRVVVVSKDSPALRTLPKGFGIIQLRGHTEDMAPLIEKFKEFRSENTLLAMGGCEAVQFVKDLHNPNTAIIAGKMDIQATSAQNSHTLMALIDRFALWEDWDELNSSLIALSGNLRDYNLMPGTPEYYKFIEEEAKKE